MTGRTPLRVYDTTASGRSVWQYGTCRTRRTSTRTHLLCTKNKKITF
jgi:hypothetical protein